MAVITYKCKNCGAELHFNPETQNYVCEYCGSVYNEEELEAANQSAENAAKEDAGKEEQADRDENGYYLYHCPSCGTEIVVDGTTAASTCFYCHNPIILTGRLSGEFMPDSVIPFSISRDQAKEKLISILKKKKFMPKGIFDENQIEEITGVYFPYWIYNGVIQGTYGARGKKVRTWRTGDLEHIETMIFHIERQGQIWMEGLARNALRKADRDLIECVLPYDMSQRKHFHMGYLSGFQAEKRDLEKDQISGDIYVERNKIAARALKDTVEGYLSLEQPVFSAKSVSENWEYVLLPVWLVTAPARDGKIYYYAMNAQTGKINGEYPLSFAKTGILSAALAILVFVLGLLGGYML